MEAKKGSKTLTRPPPPPLTDHPAFCDKGGKNESALIPHNLPTALATPSSDEEDDLSTLASAKTSGPDEEDDDSSDYKDTNSDVAHTPDKHNALAQNSEMESDASVSVISTASKISRCSRRLKRNQAATPVRVYNTRLSIGVRRQGGD